MDWIWCPSGTVAAITALDGFAACKVLCCSPWGHDTVTNNVIIVNALMMPATAKACKRRLFALGPVKKAHVLSGRPAGEGILFS